MNKMDLRVHVAPIGFEEDRIVLTAEARRADKVYLMVHENPAEDEAKQFTKRISERLKGMEIEVEIREHNRLDLFNIIRTVKGIIREERGNRIYVNLASGSKIQAIGGMMACMMFNEENNVIPLYVEAKEYIGEHGRAISRGIKEIRNIPSYEIQKPADRLVRALGILKGRNGRVSKKEMAEMCINDGLIRLDKDTKNVSQATFASLDKNIIQPLREDWGFIEVEKIGRTRWITITEDGQNAAQFLI